MKKYLVWATMLMLLTACGEKKEDNVVANEEAVVQAEDGVFNLSMANNHAEFTAKVGQEVAVKLDANATTGYKWNFITFVSGEDIVDEMEEGYIENEHPEGMVGVGGFAIYKIKLLNPGIAVITANYGRDEVADPEPKEEDEFSVKVVIE